MPRLEIKKMSTHIILISLKYMYILNKNDKFWEKYNLYIDLVTSGRVNSGMYTAALIFIKTAGIKRLSVFAKRNFILYQY